MAKIKIKILLLFVVFFSGCSKRIESRPTAKAFTLTEIQAPGPRLPDGIAAVIQGDPTSSNSLIRLSASSMSGQNYQSCPNLALVDLCTRYEVSNFVQLFKVLSGQDWFSGALVKNWGLKVRYARIDCSACLSCNMAHYSPLWGDINSDGSVDMQDFALYASIDWKETK